VNRSAFIYITGADGTGKSTHAQLLCEHLQREGIRCINLWLRFPFFFSLPVLAYARLRGYSWHEVTEGVDHGYWDFRRSWLMRQVFPVALLMDASLASLFRVYLPLWWGMTIVCERYILDMLIDLNVALDDPAFHLHRPGILFLRLLPPQAKIVVLNLDAPTVRQRRPDLRFDKRLEARLAAYCRLAADLSLPLVSTAGPLGEVAAQLGSIIGERP
jgi:hypothetical protein